MIVAGPYLEPAPPGQGLLCHSCRHAQDTSAVAITKSPVQLRPRAASGSVLKPSTGWPKPSHPKSPAHCSCLTSAEECARANHQLLL
jgi:hypothetical protein